MAEILLDLRKSLEENAASYFEKSKKIKKKIPGLMEAIEKTRQKIRDLEEKKEAEREKQELQRKARKKWYHKFRWFRTSDGFLVVGGRDATTNEIVIKKHTDPDDVVFHTDMAGSPFFVIKAEGREISGAALRETADATCSFSRAWQKGLASQQVFYVKPEQVSKEAQPGEYISKGAFMIRGRTNYVDNKISCAAGITSENEIMCGPVESVRVNCVKYVEIAQGDEKTSAVAKIIQKKIGGDLDAIIRAMPAGGVRIK